MHYVCKFFLPSFSVSFRFSFCTLIQLNSFLSTCAGTLCGLVVSYTSQIVAGTYYSDNCVVGVEHITSKVHILSFQTLVDLTFIDLIESTGLFKDRLYFKTGTTLI